MSFCTKGINFIDSNITKGIRCNPTVQQGGTGTIQQSIYLTHENPCGTNLLIYEEIGATRITFFQLKEFLDNILKTPEVLDKFKMIEEKGTIYLYEPTVKTQLAYLNAAMEWGIEAAKFIPDVEYRGYRWRLSVFDINGVMIWDSFAQSLRIVRNLGSGNLGFTFIPLVTEFTQKLSNPPPVPLPPNTVKFKNPFLLQTTNSVQLYGICNNTSVLGFLNRQSTLADMATRSSYLVNQAALPESTMAITSLLNDPANTRTFGAPRYGFSARQATFNNSLLGYHCVYLKDIFTAEETPTLIETMFIRLSLEQRPIRPIE